MRRKVCTKCDKELPATSEYFYKQKYGKYGFQGSCKKCKSKQIKQYQNSKEGALARRDTRLRCVYGSNAPKIFNKFFAEQEGFCPGCRRHESELKRHLDLDHDHETGLYRGLLCNKCNQKIGSSKKELKILRNLVKYLEDFYGKDS